MLYAIVQAFPPACGQTSKVSHRFTTHAGAVQHNRTVLPGEEAVLAHYCAFFHTIFLPKGVFFVCFCDILILGAMFCAFSFLLLSCDMFGIILDPHFHVFLVGGWVVPGSAQNRRYVTPVLRAAKPCEPVVHNAGPALNPAFITPV